MSYICSSMICTEQGWCLLFPTRTGPDEGSALEPVACVQL